MKIFSILEPVSREFLEKAARQLGLDLEEYKNYKHPQEDYLLVSKRYPIFAVADGITLELDKAGNYQNPSPAGELAKFVCESAVYAAEKIYDEFDEKKLVSVFKETNNAARLFNEKHGRTKDMVNYWDFDFFATTFVFALIKNDKIFWFNLCDSGIALFDFEGKKKFISPDCWPVMTKHLPENWKEIAPNERKKIIRRVYRNGLGKNGELIGYGVITGDPIAERYINWGILDVVPRDIFFLFTDGFEEYISLPDFVGIFQRWPYVLESQVKKFTAEKTKENCEKWGHERSLIAIQPKE